MSDTLQVEDLVNGKLDTDSLAGVAMVGTTADTITNREGVEIDTLEGRLKKVGFEPPLPYAAGIEFLSPADAVKSFDQNGIVYGCLASKRPFTTTGNFAADEVNFFVIQDTGGTGNVRADQSNTYAAGTTQAFAAATASTMSVGGVDVTAKNAAQDEATEIAQATADSVVNAIPFTKTVTSTSITHEATKNSTYKINSTMSILFTGSGGACGVNISISGVGASNVRMHTISINDSSGEISTGSYGGIGNISISGSFSGNPSSFTGFLNGTFTVLSGDTITITPFESTSSASITNSVLTLEEMTG